MELIERYIYAVTQRISQAQRKDIAIELRGLIEDMVDERTEGKNATEKDIEAVLLELGNPKKLAEQYRGTNKYLIGPDLFDSYAVVLKIVLTTIAIIIGSIFVIRVLINPLAILDHFIEFIVSTVTGLPAAFGWTTLSFAMVERSLNGKTEDLHLETEWTIKDLPPIPQKGNINKSEPIIGIIFYTILLIFFTFSMKYFGVWIITDEYTGTISFINENANGLFLILIIIVLGFGILKESFKLIYGRWNRQIVIFTLILNIISFFVVLSIITQPDFWNPQFMDQLVQHKLLIENSEAYTTIGSIWNGLTKWVPITLAFFLVWDVIDGIFKVRKAEKEATLP